MFPRHRGQGFRLLEEFSLFTVRVMRGGPVSGRYVYPRPTRGDYWQIGAAEQGLGLLHHTMQTFAPSEGNCRSSLCAIVSHLRGVFAKGYGPKKE